MEIDRIRVDSDVRKVTDCVVKLRVEGACDDQPEHAVGFLCQAVPDETHVAKQLADGRISGLDARLSSTINQSRPFL